MSWSYYLRSISSTLWATKIATSSVVSALLYHRSYRVRDPYQPFWIFLEITADYSFPDFRSPFPVPRFSNILCLSKIWNWTTSQTCFPRILVNKYWLPIKSIDRGRIQWTVIHHSISSTPLLKINWQPRGLSTIKQYPGSPVFTLKKKEQNKTKKHNITRAEEGGNYVRKYTFFFIKTFLNIIITIFLYFARLLQQDFVLFSHFWLFAE